MVMLFIENPSQSCRESAAIWDAGSHNVSWCPTQVNVETGQYSICLSWRDGRLSWLWCWPNTGLI